MAGNDARYKDWVDDRCYLYRLWRTTNLDRPFNVWPKIHSIYHARETEKVGDVGGDQTESHDVLIGKGKLSVAHHVAGQT